MNQKKASRTQRKGAKEILRLGEKVLAYRRDLLPEEEVQSLHQANLRIAEVLKSKPVYGDELEKAAQVVDSALQKSGGLYYHRKVPFLL